MQLTKEIYETIKKEKLIADHFFTLWLIWKGDTLPPGLEMYKLLLQKRGFLNFRFQPTEKCINLLEGLDVKVEITPEVIEKRDKGFSDFCLELFAEMKAKIKELVGKEQWKNPSGEYLRPSSARELQEQLEKFIRKYNYTDLDKIKVEILNHITYAITANKDKVTDKYVRSVYYFIMKKDFPSELLKKLNNEEEDKKQAKPAFGAVDI